MKDTPFFETDMEKFRESRFYKYYEDFINKIDELNNLGIRCVFLQVPIRNRIKTLTGFERERLDNWTFDFNNITENDIKKISRVYPEIGADIGKIEYLKQVYDGAKVYEVDGIKHLADFRSKYVNIINGRRITFYQPDNYKRKIYVFGQCTARGTGVKDEDTIESFLQFMLNAYRGNYYRVENCAIGCGSDIHDDLAHVDVLKGEMKKGDIVIFCTNLEIVPMQIMIDNGIDYYDSSSLFDNYHQDGEWFTDMTCHTTPIGNKLIAGYISDIIKKHEEFYDVEENENNGRKEGTSYTEPLFVNTNEFVQYINSIKKYRKKGKNGAIVMNCNPFTRGHRYLIEESAKKVDNLYLFVVEENRSFFDFEDRIRLVKLGVSDISNVIVLPSGKFIISAITFPGYFLKDGNKEIEVNVSDDVYTFAKYIAPELGICERFVGEEPYDYVTRTYNQEMKRILPANGIDLVEIPRKEVNGYAISASRVRNLIQEKNFKELRKLVPDCTFDYIMERYG